MHRIQSHQIDFSSKFIEILTRFSRIGANCYQIDVIMVPRNSKQKSAAHFHHFQYITAIHSSTAIDRNATFSP